jgi:hypothetical protein
MQNHVMIDERGGVERWWLVVGGLVRGYRSLVRGCVEIHDFVPYNQHIPEIW